MGSSWFFFYSDEKKSNIGSRVGCSQNFLLRIGIGKKKKSYEVLPWVVRNINIRTWLDFSVN